MSFWREVVAQKERYEDLLGAAERNRIVLHELALREGRQPLRHRAMARLGRGLVVWGWRLQEVSSHTRGACDIGRGAAC